MESNKRTLPSDTEEAGPSTKALKLGNQLEENSVLQEEIEELNFENVIENDVVFDVLEKMLDYDDLKSLRLVCKKCEEVVLKHKFIRKTEFIVRDKTIDSRVLDHMRFKPKHLTIRQFSCVDLEETVTKKPLPKDFSIQKITEILGYRVRHGDDDRSVPIWSIDEIQPVLKLCEGIDTLKIYGPERDEDKEEAGYGYYPKEIERLFPPKKDLLAAAKLLKSLMIECLFPSKEGHEEFINDVQISITVDEFTLRGRYRSLIPCVKFKILNSLKLDSVNENLLYVDCDVVRKVQDLIASNSGTLQMITLNYKSGEHFSPLRMAECTFPKLEYFKTSFKESETEALIDFLSSHFSQLKKLSLRFNGYGGPDFPIQLLRFIDNLKSCNLSTLRLCDPTASHYWMREEDMLDNQPTMSLNLRHFSSLKEFVMDFRTPGGVSLSIQDLPPSIQKIVIRPAYPTRDRLFPGENIDEVLKI